MMLRAKALDFDATWSVLQHQVTRGAAWRGAARRAKSREDKGTASCNAPAAARRESSRMGAG
jgi:hypothetical protein